MENNEAEEDSDERPEREYEAKSSAGEDVDTSSGVGGADQSAGYIVYFTNAVELHQKKNQNCSDAVALTSGSTINAVTPKFIKACSLDVSPLSVLVDGMLCINCLGGLLSQPLGYVIIRVQVDRV